MSLENTQVIEEEESGSTGSTGSEGGASSTGSTSAGRSRIKKKGKQATITDVIVHIYASFNNTIVTVTDVKGNVISWATAGGSGFRGSRKSTPFAAQVAAGKAMQKACERGAKTAEIWIRGPGPGRDGAARIVRDYVVVSVILDGTTVPFNGCRAPKPRRV